MALSEKDVRGIAEYAKIALTDDELTQMTSYLNDAVQMLEPVLQYDLARRGAHVPSHRKPVQRDGR